MIMVVSGLVGGRGQVRAVAWCRRRHRDQCSCSRGAGGCWLSPLNSRRISLRVNGISRSSPPLGWAVRMDRNAQASRGRMVQRCQGGPGPELVLVQRGQFLDGREPVRDLPPGPGYLHQLGQRHRVRGMRAVEGVLAVADPPAD